MKKKTWVFVYIAGIALSIAVLMFLNQKNLQDKYQRATQAMERASYMEAFELFTELDKYSDAQTKAKNAKYAFGDYVLNKGLYEEAIQAFSSLNDYKDAALKIDQANALIIEREYQKAETYFNAGNMLEAEKLYSTLNGYKETSQRMEIIDKWKLEYSSRLVVYSESWDKHGYMDAFGQIIIPAAFTSAEPFSEGVAAVKVEFEEKESYKTVNKEYWTYIDAFGNEVFPHRFSMTTSFHNGHAAVGEILEDGSVERFYGSSAMGVINRNGEYVIEPMYGSFEWLTNDTFIGYKSGEGYGIFTLDGRTLLDPIFSSIGPENRDRSDSAPLFSEGTAVVKYQEKFGYISDTDYRILIKPQYDKAEPFVNGAAIVSSGRKFGLIDVHNKVLIPLQYDEVHWISNELLSVQVDHSYFSYPDFSVLDVAGEVIIPVDKYGDDPYATVIGDYIIIRADYNGKASLFKKSGQMITEYNGTDTDYLFGDSYTDVLSSIVIFKERKDRYYSDTSVVGFLTSAGELITLTKPVDTIEILSETLLKTRVDYKWGLMDFQGRALTGNIWDEIGGISEGIVKVELDNKWGCITTEGKSVSDAIWDGITDFTNGRAVVKTNALYDYIDTTGKQITHQQFDEAKDFSEGYARVNSLDRWGFVDMDGNISIPLTWEKATDFQNGTAFVAKEGKHYMIYPDGEAKEVALNDDRFEKPRTTTRQNVAEVDQKTKTCLQCGVPIYADETWCDDCLFGSFGK